MPPRVFISHSSEDKNIADTVCQRLESDGIKCWIAPRDIQPGSAWTKAILQGIEAVSPTSGLSYYLDTVQWLDAINPPLDKHISILVERVKALLAGTVVNGPSKISPRFLSPARTRRHGILRRPAVSITILALCLIALVAAGLFITLNRKATSSDLITTGAIPAKSIAVLPFETLSKSKDDSYFADGVQDEILNSLARIAELKVIS